MKVSLIIPVYNALRTLPETLKSVSSQSTIDFEVIFVNDCSTDSSRVILEEFARNARVICKIIDQPKNMGVASTRNAGLDVAMGEYVMWLDADDSLVPDSVSKAIELASKNSADIVGWDWTLGFSQNGRYMRQADYSDSQKAIKNMMGGVMRWNLWLFMVRRDLIEKNGIRFIPGANMGEDMMFMMKAFLCADKVVQIHDSLYMYNALSSTSISKQFSELRRHEVNSNIDETVHAVCTSKYSKEFDEYILYLKLFVKLPLLMSSDREDYYIWYNWMPESNEAVMANSKLPLRTRLVQWLAAHKCWLAVNAYYSIVYKFVYGLIYR